MIAYRKFRNNGRNSSRNTKGLGGHGDHTRPGALVCREAGPKRYTALDPRGIVRVALRANSERQAREKAPRVEAGLQAYWEALEAGNSDQAAPRYKATVALAEARGFAYRPAADLIAGDFAALVERVKAAIEATGSRPAAGPDADALLGLVPDAAAALV